MSESSGTRSLLGSFNFNGLPVSTGSHGNSDPRPSANQTLLTQILEGQASTASATGALAESLHSGRARNLSEALQQLNPTERQALENRWGRSLAEIESLSHERDPQIFYHGLLQIGQRLEDNEQLEQAGIVYSAIVAGNSPHPPLILRGGEDRRASSRIFSGGGGEVPPLRIRGGQEGLSPVPAGIRDRAQVRLNAMTGVGAAGERIAFLARRISTEATRPDMLFAMGAAGATFRLARLATTARLAGTVESGLALNAATYGSAFLAETVAFTGVGKVAGQAFGYQQDWSPEAVFHEWAGGATMLLGLKVTGALAGAAAQRYARGPGALERFTQVALPQFGMFGGILLGHRLEEAAGFRTRREGDTWFVDGLSTLLQFNVAGRLQSAALGEGFTRFERRLDFHTEMLTQEATGRPGILDSVAAMVAPDFVTPEGIRISESEGPHPYPSPPRGEGHTISLVSPSPLGGEGGRRPGEGPGSPLTQTAVFSVRHDGELGGGASSGSGGVVHETSSGGESSGAAAPETGKAPAAIVRRSASGEAPRRIDPAQTLVVLPMGALTPFGTERSTYQRAVGDPTWYAEVGVINGHLEYRGNGVYADKASGEVLSVPQIVERYGEAIRRGTGIRELKSDLPLETPWAGQIPEGLRPEGKIAEAIFKTMGVGKGQFPYIRSNAQFAAQGLYALARSGMQWGEVLDNIVGHDPRRLAISVSSGLGGMENFIELILKSVTRKSDAENHPTTSTNPGTGPLVLPGLLIDAMQGLYTSVLGPKGEELPVGLTPETVIRTVGPVPVDVGACATFLKTLVAAANLFRPTWPGQTPVELAIFGSSEAAHGMVNSRPEATGFNAMGAMDTLERLAKRRGISRGELAQAREILMASLQDSYAPLTTDVGGFRPSEGSGAGGLTRLNRAFDLGLPFDVALAGYSLAGDQGGKSHPGNLGLGGATALMESLNMALAWQGLHPSRLRYMSLHGTGTPDNNEVEPANLLRVLDAFGYEGPLHLTALKALLGHGLGAAGAMETSILMMAARHGLFPGAFNLEGRELDAHVKALGNRVKISSEPVQGIDFFGSESQGFAGNNAAALFRTVDDQVLHEVYGYSLPEIEAYHGRLSERHGQAREWEESIRTGKDPKGEPMSMGRFLQMFGLSDKPPTPPTIMDMGGSGGSNGGEGVSPPPAVDPLAPTEPAPTITESVSGPSLAKVDTSRDLEPRPVRVSLSELTRIMEERDRPGADLSQLPDVVELLSGSTLAGPDSMRVPAVLLGGLEGRVEVGPNDSMAAAVSRFVAQNYPPESLPPSAPPSIDPAQPFPPHDLAPREEPGVSMVVIRDVEIRDRGVVPPPEAAITLPSPPPSDARELEMTTLPSPAAPAQTIPTGASSGTYLKVAAGEMEMEPEALQGKAAAFLRGIRVTPWQRMVVSVGEGEMLTTRGTLRATRSAAMQGIDHPVTLAYLAEDFGLTRYMGRNDAGGEAWVRASDGRPITPEQVEAEFGERLLRESGIRDIPLEGDAQKLPVRHGGMLPEPLRGKERVLARMGMDPESLQANPAFANQTKNLGSASDMAVYGLFVALGATTEFGRPLHELFASHRFGASQGGAASGNEKWVALNDRAREGRDSVTYDLQSALAEAARGNYLNLILPHGAPVNFKANLGQIVRDLISTIPGDGSMPNIGGVNLAVSAACASGLYALWGAREAMIPNGVTGEHSMDAMMMIGADATFSPYGSAPMVAGFSRRAPMTMTNMVEKLRAQGRIPSELEGRPALEIWAALPEAVRQQARNAASSPFTRFAKGLVVAEGAAAMPYVNFQTALERGLWPSSRLVGIHLAAGEGGANNLASMDQGIVGAARVALKMAAAHGVVPRNIQTHGTSTELNNFAEILSLYFVMRDEGYNHQFSINALKGLVAHAMGAASAIDDVFSTQTLLTGEAPGLFNFRTEDLDPRFAERAPEILKQFSFSSEPVRGVDSILLATEGFLSANAAAVKAHFPQDAEGARELLRDYGVPEHTRRDWSLRADENRARGRELRERLRRGKITYLQALDELRFRP